MSEPFTETIGTESVINEIFLTPRVIDAGAFGKYSAVLRELIESGQAVGQRLIEQRELTQELLTRTESRTPRNGSASDASRPIQAKPSSIDTAAAGRIARLEVTVAELAGRLEQAEASAAEAKSIAKERGSARSPSGEREYSVEFDEGLARTEAAEGRLREMIKKAEHVGEELTANITDVIGKAANQGAELTAMIIMLAEQVEKAEAVQGLESLSTEAIGQLGELIEHGQAVTQGAAERIENLESLNIRADASGEALLRAVRAATDGACGAEQIATTLGGLIERGGSIAEQLSTHHANLETSREAMREAQLGENLDAGTRLTIGNGSTAGGTPQGSAAGMNAAPDTGSAPAMIAAPATSPTPAANPKNGTGPSVAVVTPGPIGVTGVRGADLGAFVERAAAIEPDALTNPTQIIRNELSPQTPGAGTGAGIASVPGVGPANVSRPTPIAPSPFETDSNASKPTLRRPFRAIDAEDFGTAK